MPARVFRQITIGVLLLAGRRLPGESLAWVALEGKNPCEIENDAGGILCDAVAHESSECRGALRLESKGIPGPATRWTSHYQIGSHMDVVLQVGSTHELG